MDTYLLPIIWVLSGVLTWWLVVRYIEEELTGRNLGMLPPFALFGPIGTAAIIAIFFVAMVEKNPTFKSWKK